MSGHTRWKQEAMLVVLQWVFNYHYSGLGKLVQVMFSLRSWICKYLIKCQSEASTVSGSSRCSPNSCIIHEKLFLLLIYIRNMCWYLDQYNIIVKLKQFPPTIDINGSLLTQPWHSLRAWLLSLILFQKKKKSTCNSALHNQKHFNIYIHFPMVYIYIYLYCWWTCCCGTASRQALGKHHRVLMHLI